MNSFRVRHPNGLTLTLYWRLVPLDVGEQLPFIAGVGRTMQDLTDARWIKLKGILFLFAGCLAAGLLLFEHLEIKTAVLLAIAVWCFCRFYYFAFYVIEHYVDPGYRFAGLWSFARYLFSRGRDRRSA